MDRRHRLGAGRVACLAALRCIRKIDRQEVHRTGPARMELWRSGRKTRRLLSPLLASPRTDPPAREQAVSKCHYPALVSSATSKGALVTLGITTPSQRA